VRFLGAGSVKSLRAVLAGSLVFGGALTAAVLRGVPTEPAPSSVPSITTTSIRVIATTDGSVSYRSDGSGPPLVMIMGLGASQDAWPPDLVNALAIDHRVIIFDNGGIGRTAMPHGTLTISAMADQTAALITALHLGQPAVLGWSMGGMIAQALAMLHPAHVSRLVLAATFAGDGTATPIPAGSAKLSTAQQLFPADQVAAQFPAYVKATRSYPHAYIHSSKTVLDAQDRAIRSWVVGTDPGGHGSIKVPTLIGDGAEDVVTLPVNSSRIAKSIPGALLHIYPDAGHGFLIQDAKDWSARVNAFLAP